MAEIIAHRGFSSREPEMTRAAYETAIAWAASQGEGLCLECDVTFSRDDQLVCLHDLTLDRTSDASGLVIQHTVAQLRRVDFGSWRTGRATPAQRALVTLEELLGMVAEARAAGVGVTLAIETKHPNPRGLAVEDRVAALLAAYGWDGAGSPVRIISFSEEAITYVGRILPEISRTFLIRTRFGRWADASLPPGVQAVGPELALVKQDLGYVARARARGHEVQIWTVNESADIALCRDLGVSAFTTDYPDRVAALLRAS